ncbi:hypothetical protein [Nitratifractor sp.]|uniref:hypothetical protein n=1 Tax=Nitratifractor sp. TaxID=2268144 RepID=UPI0025F8252C|nr:hypothetical protein [Nitratifractor sp.]
MIHMMKKIADWIVDNEKKEATDCSIPDEIVDEWLETIEERKQRMEEHGRTHSEQYEMLLDLEKKVKEIEEERAKKCRTDKEPH